MGHARVTQIPLSLSWCYAVTQASGLLLVVQLSGVAVLAHDPL
jgi:hypothetical protein